MNLPGVLFLLGRLLLALAAALLVPTAVAYLHVNGTNGKAFLIAAMVAGTLGAALQRVFRDALDEGFGRREAFVLVTFAWITASAFGAIPYIIIKGPTFIVDGLFESASGFTTTGASILADIEAESPGFLLWRSLTQWLGGMGIIVLGIAVLPKLAIGGMDLLGAEAPGPTTEKLTPRIAQTAKALWVIYAVFTAAEALALWLAGMTVFDAVNHALTTMATGGFSTNNASVAGFASPLIEVIITVFMVIAGANFALHFQLFRGRPGKLLRDSEFRFFMGLLGLATVLLAGDLLLVGRPGGFLDALRLGAFQSVTMMTTTGFATADFHLWPHFSRALLFLLMFVGGCAGSTGGSVKVVRIMIVAKKLVVDLKRMVRPHAVLPVRVGRQAIPEDVVTSVTTFFILFLVLFTFGGLMLAAMGMDLITAFSASAACLGNIGPGFELVGPTHNFGFMPAAAKVVLILLMIIGRLELYTMLVLFFMRFRS